MYPTISLLFSLLLLLLLPPSLSQAPQRNGRGVEDLSPQTSPRRNRNFCRRLRIRTLTGECTSSTFPFWGEAGFAQFSYIDGSSSRIPAGSDLKSARQISNIVFNQDSNIPNARNINQLFVFFGQFLDHNLVATPSSERGETMDIPVPDDDEHLPRGSTLSFTRSQRGDPRTDYDRPINILSSAVDLVAVYGPSIFRNNELQEFDRFGNPTGRLKVSDDDQNLLPRNENGVFNAPDTSRDFFLAGDHRVNEHPLLTAMHTLFVREHNRLAAMVEEAMPGLRKEMVYDYARILNIAQYQKIVFEEFYPAIMGTPGQLPRYRRFNRHVNPTVSDVFAGAAFRIGHTMVDERIPRARQGGRQLPSVRVQDTFFQRADTFTNDEMDNVIRGVANTVAQEVDTRVVDTLRNQLFEHVPQEDGFDLIALNIQRGRDHNLPKYNEMREVLGLDRVHSFEDIQCDAETRRRLSTAYRHVDDIEVFAGLLAESHVPGSSVGETMMALWREEFAALRDGDQFLYLNRRIYPRILKRRMRGFIRRLTDPRDMLFKEVLVENTGIQYEDLPRYDKIFMTD